MRALEILNYLLEEDNCTNFTSGYIQKAIDELENYYTNKDSFKFIDKCPDYKTIEQYQMFISSRNEDVKNMNKAIKEAENKILLFNGIYSKRDKNTSGDDFYRDLAKKFLGY